MFRAALTLGLAFGTASTAAAGTRCDSSRTIRVLFIGNSYTYVNNAPRLVEGISASLSGRCVESSMIAVGGMSLEGHWAADSVVRRIREGRWTAVVLQDQSSLGDAWVVDGKSRIGDSSAELSEFGGRFARAIIAAGAKPILLSHWADDRAPARDQQALDFAFATVARATGSTLAPVGEAIKRARATMPGVTPYFTDGHHLSAVGSYLEALVLYVTLTGSSPIGAARRIEGPAVEFNRGLVARDSVGVLVDIPDSVAAPLQRIAAAVHSERGKLASVAKPVSLSRDFPKLPAHGDRIDARAVGGRWRGSSTVLATPSNDAIGVELVLQAGERTNAEGDTLRLRAGPIEFVGLVTHRVEGDRLIVAGTVTALTRVGRTGAAVPFAVELRAAMQAGALSGVVTMHQPGNPSMPATDAVGSVKLSRDSSG